MEMPTLKRPLRPNVALAIDGGGIKGVMVARALMMLGDEAELGRLAQKIVDRKMSVRDAERIAQHADASLDGGRPKPRHSA